LRVRFQRANLQLRRAQIILMFVVLLPTIAMMSVGVVLIATSEGSLAAIISGVLVLTFCTSGITGYILGSVFVAKGAALVRMQTDFVSHVSHELRTPLTSIHLLLEALVSRVLELSRLQSSYVYARDPLDLASVVDESIAAFDAITLKQPTPITLRLPAPLQIVGDRPTLVRALVNLLTNAWKYTGDDKQIAIEVGESRRWIEIIVRDNGAGIAPNEQRKIFEQFQRGSAADSSGAPGIGLGLSFVNAIVRGHRGKLDFVSEPGRTAFRIRLRRRRAEASPVLPPVPARRLAS
jgi:two-component system phosphate regulon sensor histidine kinase PhoR